MEQPAKHPETPEEIGQMAAMPSSSPEQNAFLKEALAQGRIAQSDCYFLPARSGAAARAVLMDGYLALFTVEDIPQREADAFLASALAEYRGGPLRTDLYSDKKHHDKVLASLLANGFESTIRRESYTAGPSSRAPETPLTFEPAGENAEESFTALFAGAAENNLDGMILKDIRELGLEAACAEEFRQLAEADFDPELWLTARLCGKPAGFVIVQKLTRTDAGIGYIGVAPAYRGREFSRALLQKARNLTGRIGRSKLVADIDAANFPMRRALAESGFALDCTVSALYREAKNGFNPPESL